MIKVIYSGKDSIKINKDISKIHESLCSFLSVKVLNVTVRIYGNRSDFNKQMGMTESADWLVANASNKNEIDILSPIAMEKESSHKKSEFLQIIKHEFTHLFIQELAKGKAIPKWLNEGVASYVAKQNQIKKESIYIEEDFCKNLSTPKDWDKRVNYSAYYISSQFVLFIIKKFSFKKIKELISSLDENYYHPSFKKIFFRVYKKELSEVEELFILELNK